ARTQRPGVVDEVAALLRPGALEARLNRAAGDGADVTLRRLVAERRARPARTRSRRWPRGWRASAARQQERCSASRPVPAVR
ncbi:MAG TPA: hypothetical protein VFW16_11805, partial [Streptosporangiaceae bacterium]|nr:hypothetical protein [Streptosporangiaceae bacterium]